MPELKPFAGVRYAEAGSLDLLACPPYDVISPAQQKQLYERHPHNAVRLELAQKAETGYAQVGDLYRRWLDEGVLVRDEPSLYVYAQRFEVESRRRMVAGVIGALTLEPFGAGVLPHEATMPGPKQDRLALMRACPVNISPIYGMYRGSGKSADALRQVMDRDPTASFVDDASVTHELWVVRDPAIAEVLTGPLAETQFVIADGHHRYETALAYREEDPSEGARAVMSYCVDADAEELFVLPYNRGARTAVDPEELISRVESRGGRRTDDADGDLTRSGADHAFVFITLSAEVLLEVDSGLVAERLEGPPAWRDLDVVALHEVVLPELVPEGIDDLIFSKDPHEIRSLVHSGAKDLGILLRAVDPVAVVDVARSGARMPQKASYFWPKAATGLVFRPLH